MGEGRTSKAVLLAAARGLPGGRLVIRQGVPMPSHIAPTTTPLLGLLLPVAQVARLAKAFSRGLMRGIAVLVQAVAVSSLLRVPATEVVLRITQRLVKIKHARQVGREVPLEVKDGSCGGLAAFRAP